MVGLLCFAAAVDVYFLLYSPQGTSAQLFQHMALLPLVALAEAVALRMLWNPARTLMGTATLSYAIKLIGIVLALLSIVIFAAKLEFVSRIVTLSWALTYFGSIITVRYFLRFWYFRFRVEHRSNFRKVLIIGTGRRAERVSSMITRREEWGTEVVGFLDPITMDVPGPLRDRLLGTTADIARVLDQNVIDEVIVAVPRKLLGDVESTALACQERGVRLRFMADLYDLGYPAVSLDFDGNIPLLSFEPVAPAELSLLIKRFVDLTFMFIATPILVPLMALIAVAIKLDSPGPVFFIQERVGLHKRRFRMFKFRSMREDAESLQAALEPLNEAAGPIFKISSDPRITRVGRLLRKTSLDELPQLFNVLLGAMSIVGPRPMSLRDVEQFDQGVQRKRFSVRPGLTCLWQVSGRSNLPFEQWLELDLQYIDTWSLRLDFIILAKTLPAIIRGDGAV